MERKRISEIQSLLIKWEELQRRSDLERNSENVLAGIKKMNSTEDILLVIEKNRSEHQRIEDFNFDKYATKYEKVFQAYEPFYISRNKFNYQTQYSAIRANNTQDLTQDQALYSNMNNLLDKCFQTAPLSPQNKKEVGIFCIFLIDFLGFLVYAAYWGEKRKTGF
jgi:hypothetical protein